MRLFVAVTPSSEALRDLDDALTSLRAEQVDALRWTSADTWHLTLTFLGEVTEEQRADLEPRLERAARRHRPLMLSLGRGGHFGSHVVFAGVDGDVSDLGSLAASVAAAARRSGIDVDERPYRPHLTLARSRGSTSLRPIAARLENYAGPPWSVADIRLIQSTPNAVAGRPPTYTTLGRWPLGRGVR